jgi:sugar O-acyltransferase (sialic acid O-acetyltransferase NeuD family)
MHTIIFGAGSQGRVAYEIIHQNFKGNTIGFLDSDTSKHKTVIEGIEVLGGMDWIERNAKQPLQGFVAIGNNDIRVKIAKQMRKLNIEVINAVHPSAVVMRSTELDSGNLVCAGAIIVTGTRLESDIVINTGVTIDHDSIIKTGAYIAPGVSMGGRVTIGNGAFIGIGAIIRPKVKIGDGCIVGAGSLVLSDIPSKKVAFGSPAKVSKSIEGPINWRKIFP